MDDTSDIKAVYVLPPQQSSLTEDDVIRIVNSMLGNQTGGNIMSSGYLQSQNYVKGVSGWQLSGSSAEFNVGVSVQSINIPDTTTASSFHVDVNGNSWWGSNVASGYTLANAYILATGAAVFKNVQIGGTTIQYVVTNSGIFSYGDANDGNATCDGSATVAGMSRSGSTYTITRDVYFNNLTINSGIIVLENGYRIFVKDTLTNAGSITRNGNDGGVGAVGGTGIATNLGGVGGSPGSALSDGYLKGSNVGITGGTGGQGHLFGSGDGGATAGLNGNFSASVTNSLGTDSVAGGNGGATENAGGTGGVSSTATPSNVRLTVGVQLAWLLDVSSSGSTVKYTSSPAGGSGAGGGGGGTGLNGFANAAGGAGGGGGGSASAGGVLAIYARSIINSGTISTNGGTGGAGGAGGNGTIGASGTIANGGAGGGGGAGGNGGVLILTYNILTNTGSITATHGNGGAGGNKGLKAGTGNDGNNGLTGNNGSDGTVYLFQLSL